MLDPFFMELNKIYNEDCMNTMAKMPDSFVDITITSPPYNVGKNRRSSNKGKSVDVKYDSQTDDLPIELYIDQTIKWIEELLRVTRYHVFYNILPLKGNTGILNVFNDHFSDKLKETFIWAKKNPQSSVHDTACAKGFEYIFCLSNDTPNTNLFSYCNFSNKSGDYMRNVMIKPTNGNNLETRGHGFAFPDWLPEHFIRHFSKPGAIVYDPFMGTGTTAKAALLLGREYIGSEISGNYLKHAENRLKPYKHATQLNIF